MAHSLSPKQGQATKGARGCEAWPVPVLPLPLDPDLVLPPAAPLHVGSRAWPLRRDSTPFPSSPIPTSSGAPSPLPVLPHLHALRCAPELVLPVRRGFPPSRPPAPGRCCRVFSLSADGSPHLLPQGGHHQQSTEVGGLDWPRVARADSSAPRRLAARSTSRFSCSSTAVTGARVHHRHLTQAA